MGGNNHVHAQYRSTCAGLSPADAFRVAAGLLIAVLVLVACGGDDEPVASSTASVSVAATSTAPPTPLPPTPPASPGGVSVVENELYRDSGDGVGSTVDIFVGDGTEGAPLVVLLHGFGMSGPGLPNSDLGPLGEEIAGLGSTVFYFGWQTARGFSAGSVGDLSCVGPFVAARAAEFGADPDNITVVGHSMGAEAGAMLALSSFGLDPSPDCTETGQASTPAAFLGTGGA
jgi:acetyl esterase/lipase